MLSDQLKRRLDMIGLKIVRGKEAMDRLDEADARAALGDALTRLMAVTKDMKDGKFDSLPDADFDDLSQTTGAMALDLKALLQQMSKMPKDENYTIVNVETRAKESPDKFLIPSEQMRRNLSSGDMVKLIFRSSGPGERMWVRVDKVLGHGQYEGELKSHPIMIESLEFGSRIKFGAENVADIQEKQGPMN